MGPVDDSPGEKLRHEVANEFGRAADVVRECEAGFGGADAVLDDARESVLIAPGLDEFKWGPAFRSAAAGSNNGEGCRDDDGRRRLESFHCRFILTPPSTGHRSRSGRRTVGARPGRGWSPDRNLGGVL